MSWKFGALYFSKDFSAQMDLFTKKLGLDIKPSGEPITVYDATSVSFRDTAVGFCNGNTLLHNNALPYDCAFEPGPLYAFDKTLLRFSHECDILCYLLDGITSTYCFSLFQEGARRRCRSVVSGKLILNEGELLTAELTHDHQALSEEGKMFSIIDAFIGKPFQRLLADDKFKLMRFM